MKKVLEWFVANWGYVWGSVLLAISVVTFLEEGLSPLFWIDLVGAAAIIYLFQFGPFKYRLKAVVEVTEFDQKVADAASFTLVPGAYEPVETPVENEESILAAHQRDCIICRRFLKGSEQ